MFFFFFLFFLASVLIFIFFTLSKEISMEEFLSSSFECGFSSYFFSRFSFSVHYFLVGLIFLFLDLELGYCFFMMVFDFHSMNLLIKLLSFILILLIGLFYEMFDRNLEWID